MKHRKPMNCPACGAEMNLHAEKIDDASAPEDGSAEFDEGGVLQEIHACPRCHKSAMRRATEDE